MNNEAVVKLAQFLDVYTRLVGCAALACALIHAACRLLDLSDGLSTYTLLQVLVYIPALSAAWLWLTRRWRRRRG